MHQPEPVPGPPTIWATNVSAWSPPEEVFDQLLTALDDEPSRKRIKAFCRPEDARRCLIGRLLPRIYASKLYHLRPALRVKDLNFTVSEHGRPYISNLQEGLTLDYNVSHDSSWVVTAFLEHHPRDVKIGIDVMRNTLRYDETVEDFIEVLSDQLTKRELNHLATSSSPFQKLSRITSLWVCKEAYTKALGLGLGFEFDRIEIRDVDPPIVEIPEVALEVDTRADTTATDGRRQRRRRWKRQRLFVAGQERTEWSIWLGWVDGDHLVATAVGSTEDKVHDQTGAFPDVVEMSTDEIISLITMQR